MTRYVRDAQGRKTKQLDTVSPELQETAGRDYCERTGKRVVAVVPDLNRTGRTLKRRKVQEAIEYVERGVAKVIVVWKWSRLARNRRDWAVTTDYIENAVGGRVESSTEPVDTTTAVGRLNRGMLAEFAAFESDRAGEVWKEIMDGRVARGLPGHGRARFGYVNTGKGRFEPHHELGDILASMYRRYIAGAGYLTIARWLNDHGCRTTGGGQFREGNVRTILDSGFGAGLIVHRRQHVEGTHKPVITWGEWEEYQRLRDERSSIPSRTKGSRYVLTGIIRCGICGSGMRANPDRYGNVWYRCRNRTLTGCPNPYVRQTDVEAKVLEWLTDLVDDADQAAKASLRAQTKVVTHRHRAEVLDRQIKQKDAALTQLTVDRAHKLVPDDAYIAARDEILATRGRLVDEHAEVMRTVRGGSRVDVDTYRGLVAEWDTLPVSSRRETLRQMLSRVRVWGGKPARVQPVPTWDDSDVPTVDEAFEGRRRPPGYGRPRRFTAEQAAEIRARHAAGESQAGLAREYGCGSSTINHLVRGISYRDST